MEKGVNVYQKKGFSDIYYWFGTDTQGRDLFTRVWQGTRISLLIALSAVLIDIFIGMHLGHIVETGTTDEIFSDPIHPYTKSLLSAIPHPNPVVEKKRVAMTYDKDKEGVDYTKGVIHNVSPTHYVLATDEEFAKWSQQKGY